MSGFSVDDRVLEVLGDEQITSLAASTALTVPSGARYAWMQADVQNIRIRLTGADPTTSVGMLLNKDSDGFWCTSKLSLVRVIEATAGAVLNVTYLR